MELKIRYMYLPSKIWAFALLAVTACGPAKVVTEYQRDSVIVHVRDSVYLRDTIVMAQIPAESGANVLQDSDTSFLQTSLAESRAYVANGKLHHTLRNKSEMLLPVKVQYVERLKSEKSSEVAWRHAVETVQVEKELSRWQSFVLSLGHAVLMAAALWVALKLSKMIPIS